MALKFIANEKKYVEECKLFLKSGHGAHLGPFSEPKELSSEYLIGDCNNFTKLWRTSACSHLHGKIYAYCLFHRPDDFGEEWIQNARLFQNRPSDGNLYILICNFIVNANTKSKAFNGMILRDNPLIIWDEINLLFYIEESGRYGGATNIPSWERTLLSVRKRFPHVVCFFDEDVLFSHYSTDNPDELFKSPEVVYKYLSSRLQIYEKSSSDFIDEVLFFKRKLQKTKLDEKFLSIAVEYVKKQLNPDSLITNDKATRGSISKNENSKIESVKEYARWLFFALSEVEVSEKNEEKIAEIYDILTTYDVFLRAVNSKYIELIDMYSQFIPVSQIELFSFGSSVFKRYYRWRDPFSFWLFSNIISYSISVVPENRKTELITVCRIKEQLGKELFLLVEQIVLSNPQYSRFFQINDKTKREDQILYWDKKENSTKRGNKTYILSQIFTRPLCWEYQLKCDKSIKWKMSISFEIQENGLVYNIIDPKKIRHSQAVDNTSVAAIIAAIKQQLSAVGQNSNTEIVALYYSEQYEGRIPERCLVFSDGVRLRKNKDGSLDFSADEKKQQPHMFYHKDKGYPLIKNISAIVGQNGAGKTTAFRMIAYDAPDYKKQNSANNYIIFYRIGETYYYSRHNLDNIRLNMGKQYDLSDLKNKNAHIIFYNGGLTLNAMTAESGIIGTDLSDAYIYKEEFCSNDIKKIWDVGRKLQFFKTLGRKEFLYQLGFLPIACHIRFPERLLEQLKDKIPFDVIAKDGVVEFNIQLKDEYINKIWELYLMLCTIGQENIDVADDIFTSIDGLSSGQNALFDFYSRLHCFFESQVEDVHEKKKKNHNCFKIGRENNGNYILMLDEIELFLHPEWQKGFIEQLVTFLEEERKRFQGRILLNSIQIILSTNAPFFMSDLPKENVCMLWSKNQEESPRTETFAQNIHTILRNSFFMGEGLTGEFAKRKITEVFDDLESDTDITEERKTEIKYIIEKTGESLIKKAMQYEYEKRYPTDHPQKSRMEQIKKLFPELSDKEMEELRKMVENK